MLVFAACSAVFDGELGVVACDDEGAYGEPACPTGETCVAGACAAVGMPIGGACTGDGECALPAHCFDPATVGQEGKRRCALSCCSSTDCGDVRFGQVCWPPPGGGGALCWSASELGRGALGEGRAGDVCANGAGCRSGVCNDGACADVCCDDANCPADEICRVKSVQQLASQDIWTCGPTGAQTSGGLCDSNDDCPSSQCVPTEPMPEVMICAQPCCSSAECSDVLVMGTPRQVACSIVGGELKSCGLLLPDTATGGVGADCSGDLECRSGRCMDGYCTDLCCNDASCGDMSAFSCVPGPIGGSWGLRCVRK
jgi:hypothetical protein